MSITLQENTVLQKLILPQRKLHVRGEAQLASPEIPLKPALARVPDIVEVQVDPHIQIGDALLLLMMEQPDAVLIAGDLHVLTEPAKQT